MTKRRVVHLMRDRYDVRIDRATRWGNPFIIGKDGDREEVIAKYRVWLAARPHLIEMAKRDLKDKVLGCWCYPEPCHGDVLVTLADQP